MTNKIYQVDAFTNHIFGGNPAAVCPLNQWLPEDIMQKIAMENNLSETAFYVKEGNTYSIRWFTPEVEVDLCGHATLATAYVIFNFENHNSDFIKFHSDRSGQLSTTKSDGWLSLNFPSDTLEQLELTKELTQGFKEEPKAVYKGKTDYLFLFDSEESIKKLEPDFNEIGKLNCRGIIVTAKGNEVDFVSRFFTPQCGINEDPVTGSAHTSLTPFWAEQLNKLELTAIQLSDRQGYLKCKLLDDRVEISGQAKLYMTGEINIS